MSAIQSVKGTRDFYPPEMAFRRWLESNIRAVVECYGYQEYDGPFIERIELYAAKSGEELVKEQSFVFPDRSGELIALRPELTPSLARMIAARSRELPIPIRWWSFGPFWRYERPQKGRTREFFQWNIDLLGVDSPQADAEIAVIAAEFFRRIGLPASTIRILVNNRQLVDQQLESIGIPADQRPGIFKLIDRRDKQSDEQWKVSLQGSGLASDQISAINALLADKQAWRQSAALVDFFRYVTAMGAGDYFEYDPSIIRGLDYYTGTVFEARDAAGEFRAILGGGRYDDLVSLVGGDPIPAIGFAMGDVVIQLVLAAYNALPELRTNPSEVLVPLFDDSLLEDSLQLVGELRRAGFRCEWYPEAAKLPKQLKYADRQGIPVAVILGPEEVAASRVMIKDLRTRTQQSAGRTEMVAVLAEIFGRTAPQKPA